MGDPLDFIDEGGWPYPDDVVDARAPEPIDLRSDADEDMIALHALTPRVLASLSAAERAAIAGRFGLDGAEPLVARDHRGQKTKIDAKIRIGNAREQGLMQWLLHAQSERHDDAVVPPHRALAPVGQEPHAEIDEARGFLPKLLNRHERPPSTGRLVPCCCARFK